MISNRSQLLESEHRRYDESFFVAGQPVSYAFVADAGPRAERLISLDALRGIIIALMVLVNNSGSFPQAYPPLLHADWNGWTITDVVFPSFVWIVGLTLTLSLSKRLAAGIPRGQLMLPILRRGAILYLLGIFLYAFPDFDFSTARILGVLQRIAICYVAASLIFLWFNIRLQILWIVLLLATYWALMILVPVPGYGAGRLDVEGNFAHYVDRIVLGAHNYSGTKTWDPEGIVSTLPAIATALFGIMAAHLLRLRRTLPETTTWLFLTGNLLLVLGLLLDVWLPINKKLWTTSFSVFMAGLDFALFATMLWLVDAQGLRRFVRPFVILGMNAIAIYMISELGETLQSIIHVGGEVPLRSWLYTNLFLPWLSPLNASLLYSLCYVGLMFLIAFAMHRRGWYLRI